MRSWRRRLLSDTVYVIFHDALKAWHKDGKTQLTPQEICLSARNLCEVILGLPDAEEGFEDELDDLEEEASDDTEAMLVEMMAASMLTALTAGREKSAAKAGQRVANLTPVIRHIISRWCDHELFTALLEEGCKKEEERFADGKRNDLLHYELMEMEREGDGGTEEMRQLIKQMLSPAFGRSVETIKETLLLLNRYNIENQHVLDAPLIELYKRLDGTTQGVSAGGDNRGIMAGGNLNANFQLTDPQAEMMAKAIVANCNKPLLGER